MVPPVRKDELMICIRRLLPTAIACLIPLYWPAAIAQTETPRQTIDFDKQVWPILQTHCVDCHGPDTQESELRLDRKWAMLRGGNSGEPAIAPGDAESSYLIQLITGNQAGKLMPPKDSGDSLSTEEISILKQWIEAGAVWPGPYGSEQPSDSEVLAEGLQHWSFQPIGKPAVPNVPDTFAADWRRNPLDAFVARGLADKHLTPSSKADRATRIRRLYLDMHGLPPTPDAVQYFVNDDTTNAWDQLVESALCSPHYGERWARYWLDLVRFAETDGFETNRERPNAWPYRDYVIRSLNEDKPYDQFLREQLAGDLFGAPEATSYLVAGPVDIVKSPDISLTLMQRQNELDDMISTTSTAFLGLTVGCARCHNHKFDPIRQTDYYGLQAIFTGVRHGNRTLPPTEGQQRELAQLDERVGRLRNELKPFLKPDSAARPAVTFNHNEELFEPVLARFIRFTVTATTGAQPCIDEIEIFEGSENLALASNGAIATCSSTLPGYEIHKLEHINDGKSGNANSWISNESGAGWIQIELSMPHIIQRIVWARDREGKFKDRLATEYHIEVATEPDQWTTVASSDDRQPFSEKQQPPQYKFDRFTTVEAARGQFLLQQLNNAEARRQQLREATTVYAGNFEAPQPTFRLFRGEPLARREQVAPSAVEVLGKLNLTEETTEQQRRKALADWITSPDNPLTARVIVNRIWQWHFGQGLVNTPSDFGKGGVKPTHPELLDWLARQLIDHNWSIKHIHRLILTSATYQQSGAPGEAGLKIDAGCQLWWRFPSRRLEAEPIRDSILSVTGLLNDRMYGPGFSAFEVDLENVRHYFPKTTYSNDDFRRMIYQTKVRQEQDSVFGIFDCPDAASSVPRRSRSTTPLQALNLLNSTFMLQQADAFANRLENAVKDKTQSNKPQPAKLQTDPPPDEPVVGDVTEFQIGKAFWLCFSRNPTPDELNDSKDFIRQQGLSAFCRAILNSNEFLFIP